MESPTSVCDSDADDVETEAWNEPDDESTMGHAKEGERGFPWQMCVFFFLKCGIY